MERHFELLTYSHRQSWKKNSSSEYWSTTLGKKGFPLDRNKRCMRQVTRVEASHICRQNKKKELASGMPTPLYFPCPYLLEFMYGEYYWRNLSAKPIHLQLQMYNPNFMLLHGYLHLTGRAWNMKSEKSIVFRL